MHQSYRKAKEKTASYLIRFHWFCHQICIVTLPVLYHCVILSVAVEEGIATEGKNPVSAPADKKQQLFDRQKETLDIFLQRGAISQAQYDKSLGDLIIKMGLVMPDKEE